MAKSTDGEKRLHRVKRRLSLDLTPCTISTVEAGPWIEMIRWGTLNWFRSCGLLLEFLGKIKIQAPTTTERRLRVAPPPQGAASVTSKRGQLESCFPEVLVEYSTITAWLLFLRESKPCSSYEAHLSRELF